MSEGEVRIRHFLTEPMAFEVPNGMKIVGETVILYDYGPMQMYRFDAEGRHARGAGWLDDRLVVLTRDPAEPLVVLEWME